MFKRSVLLATVLFFSSVGALSGTRLAMVVPPDCVTRGCKVSVYAWPWPSNCGVVFSLDGDGSQGFCTCDPGWCDVQQPTCQFSGTVTVTGGPDDYIEIGTSCGRGSNGVEVDTGLPGCDTASITYTVKVYEGSCYETLRCMFDLRVVCAKCYTYPCD